MQIIVKMSCVETEDFDFKFASIGIAFRGIYAIKSSAFQLLGRTTESEGDLINSWFLAPFRKTP
jgi:hypothetical protein